MQTVKMVVTGPFSSGKTEFIGSVSEIDVVATERKITGAGEKEIKDATTVAMDFGRITVDDDLVLYLFGTPGQKRFDLCGKFIGRYAWLYRMIDSCARRLFARHEAFCKTFRAYAPTS